MFLKRRTFVYSSLIVVSCVSFASVKLLGPIFPSKVKNRKNLSKGHLEVLRLLSPVLLGLSKDSYEELERQHIIKIDQMISSVDKFQRKEILMLLSLLRINFVKDYIISDTDEGIEHFLNKLRFSKYSKLRHVYSGLIKIITSTWYDMEQSWRDISYEKVELS